MNDSFHIENLLTHCSLVIGEKPFKTIVDYHIWIAYLHVHGFKPFFRF